MEINCFSLDDLQQMQNFSDLPSRYNVHIWCCIKSFVIIAISDFIHIVK